ncbi:MAG: DUF1778 domain-containing protein [Pseudomonadota bacterium]
MASNRSERYQLRFTPEEREVLQAAAERNGMSLAAFLRYAALKVARDG